MAERKEPLAIAVEVANGLWERDRPVLDHTAALFARCGFTANKKQNITKEHATRDGWMALAEDAYKTGLARGYAMGHSVFDTSDEVKADARAWLDAKDSTDGHVAADRLARAILGIK